MKAYKIFSNNGSAIAYGLIIIAVVSVLLTGIVQFIASQIRYASYVDAKERSFHIAESGIYFYRWYLAHEIEGKNPQEVLDFWTSNPSGVGDPDVENDAPYIKDYLDVDGSTVIGESEINVNFPRAGDYNVIEIVSTGYTANKPDIKRTIKSRLRRSVWSDFAVLSDAPLCMDPYWTVNGKIMGNNGVHFDGVANNIVMAGVNTYNDTNHLPTVYNGKNGVWTLGTESSVFKAGKKFPVPKKDFTGVTAYLQAMREEARKNVDGSYVTDNCNNKGTGCYFDNTEDGRRIILSATNDKFDVCIAKGITSKNKPNKYKNWENSQSSNDCSGADYRKSFDIPQNGIIFVDDNVWLEGTIDGRRVSVVSADIANPNFSPNIYIGFGNIKYTNSNGDDILGIVSEGDIEILEESPNELEIDGALLAQNGAVTKPEYNEECCGDGCLTNKNYLNVMGCVITKNGIAFGYHKTSCPRLNLERNITYDNNLYLYPPPYFPADSFYYVDLWEEI